MSNWSGIPIRKMLMMEKKHLHVQGWNTNKTFFIIKKYKLQNSSNNGSIQLWTMNEVKMSSVCQVKCRRFMPANSQANQLHADGPMSHVLIGDIGSSTLAEISVHSLPNNEEPLSPHSLTVNEIKYIIWRLIESNGQPQSIVFITSVTAQFARPIWSIFDSICYFCFHMILYSNNRTAFQKV